MLPMSGGVDVYIVDADGSNLVALTRDGQDRIETYLSWRKDGSRLFIVWERPEDPYHQFLASMNVDGSDRIELGSVQAAYTVPTMSPDGRYVAFSGDGDTAGRTGLILLDLETGARRALRLDGSSGAMWSADGTRILTHLPSRQVGVVEVATGTYSFKLEADVAQLVGWAADDQSILFVGCTDSMSKEACMAAPVLVAGPGSPVPTRAQDLPARIVGVPSPDGTWVAVLNPDCRYAFARPADVEPADLRTANDIEMACSGPLGGVSWSPDSRWLARSAANATPFGFSIVLETPLGSDSVDITSGARDGNPAWQPS